MERVLMAVVAVAVGVAGLVGLGGVAMGQAGGQTGGGVGAIEMGRGDGADSASGAGGGVEEGGGWQMPREASRVPASWDFDDRVTPDGIILPFPRGWVSGNPASPMAPRRGFPFYNEPGYSTEASFSGDTSFKLPTRGGSTSAMLAAGLLPSMPGADYIAVARVRTAGLEHARARLVARYADASAASPNEYASVSGTERASRAVVSEGGWSELRVRLPARSSPSYLQLELQLLQPEQMAGGRRARHESLEEDVSGAAYFDDVAVFQAPRLGISTNSAVNMVVAPERVALSASVRDLTGEALSARIWVWDMEGSLVDRFDFAVSRTAPLRVLEPALPSYGWYRATLAVRNERAAVGVESVDFAWFAPDSDGFSRDPTRFGVVAEGLAGGELSLLAEAVGSLQVGAAALSAWGSLPEVASGAFDAAVDAMLSRDIELTFVLGESPEELARAAKLDPEEVLAMLSGDPSVWLSSLTPVLSVYGERVLRWQIGRTAGDEAVVTARRGGRRVGEGGAEEAGVGGLGEQLRGAAAAIRELVPGARLVLPWPVQHTAEPLVGRGSMGLSAAMRVSPGLPAESVGGFVSRTPEGVEASLVLESVDAGVFGRASATEDLAKRAVLAWEAGVERISVAKPWVWRGAARSGDGGVGGGRLMPTPTAAVWRTVASALAGHDAVGRLPGTAEGRVVIVGRPVDGSSSGVLVGWSDRADGGGSSLRAFLGGDGVAAMDLFGNEVEVVRSGGEHEVPLGRLPVIVEGVDWALLRFWSSMRFEPGVIPSRAERHALELVLENPWPRRISGVVRLAEPEAWGFEPRVLSFGIDAGETVRLPVSARLGVGEESGVRRVEAEVLVSVGVERFGPIGVPIATELGLEGVTMGANYRLARGATGELDRVIVTVFVTNEGERPLTLEAFSRAMGHRAQRAPISDLAPGDSETVAFVFDDASETIIGGVVRAGVRELGGNGRLNRTMRVRRGVR